MRNIQRASDVAGVYAAAGGDATQVQLPALGIQGDSHMYFWENHSFQIAQIVVDWIKKH